MEDLCLLLLIAAGEIIISMLLNPAEMLSLRQIFL